MKAQARRHVGRGRLHVALTSAGECLAAPTNLQFDDAHLDDDAMKAALDDLLTESLTWAIASLTLQRRKPMANSDATAPSAAGSSEEVRVLCEQ